MAYDFITSRISTVGEYRIRDMYYPAGLTQSRHAHDLMQISVVLRGTYREDVASATCTGSAADVVFKPAAFAHANEFARTRIVCIDGPPDELELGSYAWHRGDSAAAAAVRLARRFVAGADVTEELDDLLAALAPRPYRDDVLASRAASAFDDGAFDRVGVRAVAAELRVHPVYLARAFRARWNCSPREYLQRVRVRRAAHRVASTDESLARIAIDAGFSDQAHMTRAFARILGVTPAVMRGLARG